MVSSCGKRGGSLADKSRLHTNEADACRGIAKSPKPLISRHSGAFFGAIQVRLAKGGAVVRITASSATSAQPNAIISAARELLPDPLGPRIKTPRSPSATHVAWARHRLGPRTWHRLSAEARATQTGRPTTNRAPSGSDVKSTSVGRMFSAQMTPPWASTICLEIARPRPE